MTEFDFQKLLPGIKKNVLLKKYTSFRIGGPAKYLFIAKTKKSLISAVKKAKEMNLSFFILGGGSNVLAADKGYEGIVIKYQNSALVFRVSTNKQMSKIYIASGIKLSDLVELSLKKSLTGLEWAAGIPGTIGGAARGNAAAFGHSISEQIKEVEVLEIKNSKTKKRENLKFEIKRYKNRDCEFNYKDSVFKHNENLIILSVVFQLKKAVQKEIREKIKRILFFRRKNHPLNFPSAGCIFQNLKHKIANPKLLKEFEDLKKFNEKKEIPAGYLIEKCGLKGKKSGEAKISEKHANFIVNLGNAKARNVKNLINLIKQKVKNKFKINLKEEIQYLGF